MAKGPECQLKGSSLPQFPQRYTSMRRNSLLGQGLSPVQCTALARLLRREGAAELHRLNVCLRQLLKSTGVLRRACTRAWQWGAPVVAQNCNRHVPFFCTRWRNAARPLAAAQAPGLPASVLAAGHREEAAGPRRVPGLGGVPPARAQP